MEQQSQQQLSGVDGAVIVMDGQHEMTEQQDLLDRYPPIC